MIRYKVLEGTKFQTTGNKRNIDILNLEFNDTELTEEEERTLIWLSTFETSSINNIISAFKKIEKNK